jgi:hypothetical protein
MTTLLEHGGTVELWAGWSVRLPSAHHVRNADGSWSAWGTDWAIDAHIIEGGGKANGEPASAEDMLGEQGTVKIRGNGWVGSVEFLEEVDSGRDVYRLAAKLAAQSVLLSFWVSYFEPHQQSFAEELVRSVAHAG